MQWLNRDVIAFVYLGRIENSCVFGLDVLACGYMRFFGCNLVARSFGDPSGDLLVKDVAT